LTGFDATKDDPDVALTEVDVASTDFKLAHTLVDFKMKR
jgi:hypothetical protein